MSKRKLKLTPAIKRHGGKAKRRMTECVWTNYKPPEFRR